MTAATRTSRSSGRALPCGRLRSLRSLRALLALAHTLSLASLVVSALTGCAAASGYDPKRYETRAAAEPPDPDTEALPPGPTPKPTIPDPRLPPAPPPAPPAPVVEAPAPQTPVASAGSKPASPAPARPKPAATPPVTATADADCGTKENPCPMQKLMRGQMTSASTPQALEAAFNRVAALSPNGGWAWASIAKKGAEAAKSGDVAGAKAQCKACHDQHKDAYKKQYRARKI